eukprot:m.9372 g.9372  ORF g.9372 m.9372 type:complete len:480 (+) comp21297_c0_seq2:76-1515(+)
MLQQILETGFIDPELLAELSEDQKQILYVKMRQGQIKRYLAREEAFDKSEKKKKAKTTKKNLKLSFMTGSDGNPWVWVMGNYGNDLKYEELVTQNDREEVERSRVEDERAAQELAQKEIEEIARKQKEELVRRNREKEAQIRREEEEKRQRELEELEKKQEKEDAANIYVNAKEARIAGERLALEKKQLVEKLLEEEEKRLRELQDEEQKELEQEIRKIQGDEVLMKKKAEEIYMSMKELREKRRKEEEDLIQTEWKKSEEKAKKYEQERKMSVRRARERAVQEDLLGPMSPPPLPERPVSRHGTAPPIRSPSRDSLPLVPDPVSSVGGTLMRRARLSRPPKPESRQAVIQWFKESEVVRGVLYDKDGKVHPWFHGILTRTQAETLLANSPAGTYIVRVSERIWGYTITVKVADRCKHFLIDAGDSHYQFFGDNQQIHFSLESLLNHHKVTPISSSGKELLLTPLGQQCDPPDYQELVS